MIEYQAKSSNFLSFDLTKDDELIGKISYKSWYKFNAEIEILNSKYQIESKGFWGTSFKLKEGEKELVKFEMNWSGETIIQTHFDELEKRYILKHKGIFKESFILVDDKGTELLIFKPHIKWNSFNYEYQITTSEIFETLSHKKILLMNLLYCVNYTSMMAMNSGM